MRKSIAIAAIATLVLGGASSTAHAASGAANTSSVSMSYDIPDIVFNGPDCFEHRYTVSVTGAASLPDGDASITFEVALRQNGASSTITDTVFGSVKSGETKQITTGYLYMCPINYSEAAGPFQLTGSFTSNDYLNPKQAVSIPSGQITVTKATSRMMNASGKLKSGLYTFKGKAVADSSNGAIGAGGTIEIQVKKKGSKRWKKFATAFPDTFGSWKTTAFSERPIKASFRAVLVDCDWCTTTSRSFKVKR